MQLLLKSSMEWPTVFDGLAGSLTSPEKTRRKCALAQRASTVAARCKNLCVHAYMQRAGTTLLFLAAVERI